MTGNLGGIMSPPSARLALAHGISSNRINMMKSAFFTDAEPDEGKTKRVAEISAFYSSQRSHLSIKKLKINKHILNPWLTN